MLKTNLILILIIILGAFAFSIIHYMLNYLFYISSFVALSDKWKFVQTFTGELIGGGLINAIGVYTIYYIRKKYGNQFLLHKIIGLYLLITVIIIFFLGGAVIWDISTGILLISLLFNAAIIYFIFKKFIVN